MLAVENSNHSAVEAHPCLLIADILVAIEALKRISDRCNLHNIASHLGVAVAECQSKIVNVGVSAQHFLNSTTQPAVGSILSSLTTLSRVHGELDSLRQHWIIQGAGKTDSLGALLVGGEAEIDRLSDVMLDIGLLAAALDATTLSDALAKVRLLERLVPSDSTEATDKLIRSVCRDVERCSSANCRMEKPVEA